LVKNLCRKNTFFLAELGFHTIEPVNKGRFDVELRRWVKQTLAICLPQLWPASLSFGKLRYVFVKKVIYCRTKKNAAYSV